MSDEQIRRVAKAIDSVQLFSRRNDMLKQPRIEICRYGVDDEPEIVVIKTASWASNESEVLQKAVSYYRAKAAVEAMRQR